MDFAYQFFVMTAVILHVQTQVPPIIEDIPDVKNVEGGQVEVTCKAAGDPVPTVIWQKQGQPAYPIDGIKYIGPQMIDLDTKDQQNAEIKRNGKIMRFDNIKAQDAGVYVCTALNVVGNASKSFKFEVRYKPHFDTSFKETKFYGWNGHTANLTCLVSANEPASILWYHIKDNQTIRIENTAPYVVNTVQQWPEYSLSSGSLMVYVSDESSPVFKDYICEATNPLGSAQQTVTLLRAYVKNVEGEQVEGTNKAAEDPMPTINGQEEDQPTCDVIKLSSSSVVILIIVLTALCCIILFDANIAGSRQKPLDKPNVLIYNRNIFNLGGTGSTENSGIGKLIIVNFATVNIGGPGEHLSPVRIERIQIGKTTIVNHGTVYMGASVIASVFKDDSWKVLQVNRVMAQITYSVNEDGTLSEHLIFIELWEPEASGGESQVGSSQP